MTNQFARRLEGVAATVKTYRSSEALVKNSDQLGL
jgi:hypothetical protein